MLLCLNRIANSREKQHQFIKSYSICGGDKASFCSFMRVNVSETRQTWLYDKNKQTANHFVTEHPLIESFSLSYFNNSWSLFVSEQCSFSKHLVLIWKHQILSILNNFNNFHFHFHWPWLRDCVVRVTSCQNTSEFQFIK